MQTTRILVKKRIAVLCCCCVAGLLLLFVRVGWVQAVRGPELARMAERNRTQDVPVQPKRGIIFDRQGHELAVSVATDSVYLMPADVRESGRSQEVAATLAAVLGMSAADIQARIDRPSAFEWVQRQVDLSTSTRLRRLHLPGVGLVQESRRFYPKKTLAAHVLGIAGIDNNGLEGIDLQYESLVGGTPGRIVVQKDAAGRPIAQTTHRYEPPVQGANLFLTLDETIQYIVERELDKVCQEAKPEGAIAIVMDPRNGEVLAMASRPTFDPNRYRDYPAENRRNRAIWFSYEPGSTFKIVTGAAALEEGSSSPQSRFYCPGSITVGKSRISCAHSRAHGAESFVQVMQNSCNVGFVSIGLNLGLDRFYKYLDAFGFGKPTGIDLPGEAAGIVVPRARATQLDLATMSIGQANAVTPIQLLAAVSAVANGGTMMRPHLLKEARDQQGKLVKKVVPRAVGRVVSEETAAELRTILQGVVTEGTGTKAFLEGYQVAGKTGTAQKINPAGGYFSDKYVASFVGFAPAEDPRLACVVVIDAPTGYSYYGGAVAAPVFKEIMRDSLRYLGVPMQGVQQQAVAVQAPAEGQVRVPDVVGLDLTVARAALQDRALGVKVEGEGLLVWSQSPCPGSTAQRGDAVTVRLTTVSRQGETVRVPDLAGKSLREAAETLERFGLRLQAQGYGIVRSQRPAPGSSTRPGATVQLTLTSPWGGNGEKKDAGTEKDD
ncbi:MAG: stage V sporulation protein D [Syntrophomonadaceae bacterium]|nr:stage V sporulation protein D [Syntrophomonadaceae bacterium]